MGCCVVFQGGAVFVPAGDWGVVGAVFPEVPGKRPPGPGAGGREAGPQAVSEREPGAQRTQPGADTHLRTNIYWETQRASIHCVCPAKLCSFVAFVGAQQPSGSRDHQDALHDIWGRSWRHKHHNTGKRALWVRSKVQTKSHVKQSNKIKHVHKILNVKHYSITPHLQMMSLVVQKTKCLLRLQIGVYKPCHSGFPLILTKFSFVFQVMLRVKESEVQYLKQEINSLKDELQAAQRVCLFPLEQWLKGLLN